jgi:DNA-binding transcriptional LysR family regulator
MRKARSHSGAGVVAASDEGIERIAAAIERACIPTDLLRTFVAICELGSFTKAAHLFGLTQPAVSSHMRRLESIIGADLLQKSLSGITLTDFGAEVLRQARRMLAINDQIVSGVGLQPNLQVIRIGIPNLYAPSMLAGILRECGRAAEPSRVQVRCDHSSALLRGIRAGHLDLVFALGSKEEMKGSLAEWPEPVVWVRAADFVLPPGAPVPLVSSPNLLPPDRIAMAALEAANRRYEIVFTAFDTMARRAAAEAGLGYCPTPRTAAMGMAPLMIEEPDVLPELPSVIKGIVARDDLDTKALASVVAALETVVTAEQRNKHN